MAKTNRSADLAQVKKSLKILRDKGLYEPKNARAKPTRYGKSLIKKFGDVVKGKAFVLSAKPEALAKLKADQYRMSHGKVVIPAQGTNVRPRISKTGDVIRRQTIGKATYRMRPARFRNGEVEDITAFQSYRFPVRHGNRVAWHNERSKAELMRLANEYAEMNGRGFDIMQYVQIVEREDKLRFRIYFVQAGKKERRRTVRAANEETARIIFREKFPEFSDWIITKVEPLDG